MRRGDPTPTSCACPVACSGTCTAGRCLETLASGVGTPVAIAVDAESVYWAETGAGTGAGRIVKLTPK